MKFQEGSYDSKTYCNIKISSLLASLFVGSSLLINNKSRAAGSTHPKSDKNSNKINTSCHNFGTSDRMCLVISHGIIIDLVEVEILKTEQNG